MDNQNPIRLRPVNLYEDCKLALQWYQDLEVIHFSEGPDVGPYDLITVQAMYEYLNSIGKLLITEVFEDGESMCLLELPPRNSSGRPSGVSRKLEHCVIRRMLHLRINYKRLICSSNFHTIKTDTRIPIIFF
ncbi:hypothetical protein MNQ98_13995 [Paenibacillus sp. N3/727]|uniref:hypothetical protein n=1 Tax=Paenibacillus sp. N3/727 TaxID=2925845 RepID=UPI001F539AF8|nr:hypothetical protein [Paenibacillus sp. N3/727]UNK21050.1 hypothetical protein MNQ98_13995 [Paenibacillus sp. N3/727]